jgi:NAD(P)-dependent dehydrogenase (short-subunit alcohol dehydrogenase family)
MRLAGKAAVVTGAANGIGRAIAHLFASEGAKVVIADIDVENGQGAASSIASRGGEASFVRCDVSQMGQVEELFNATASHFGHVDILINNAARWEQKGYLLDIDEKTWEYVLNGTLRSVYLCSKCAIPQMISGGWGSIVNISSANALFGVNLAAYTAAKGAVIALTRIIAVQYGSKNIRANVICPGTIETEAVAAEFKERPDVKKRFLSPVPLRRFGRPEDVAYCALYLASSESDFVTGATFLIDGGLTAGVNLED